MENRRTKRGEPCRNKREPGEEDSSPGVWSTDEYIRAWAARRGMREGECLVPLQSLHGFWMAKISFDRKGLPVERFADAALHQQAAQQAAPEGKHGYGASPRQDVVPE